MPHCSALAYKQFQTIILNPITQMGIKCRGIADNLFFDNWLLLLIQRLFFRGSSLVVYKKKQLRFIVDFAGGDASGTRYCLTSDMYSRYYKHWNQSRPLTVLDLGANGGGFLLSLCDRGFTIQQAVCVEMNPQLYTRLTFNLAYNHIAAVPVNAAVSARSGIVEIPDSHGGTGESIYQQRISTTKTVPVPLTTFDELVASHFGSSSDAALDIVKMDVEGAEYEILLSTTCSSIRRFKYLLMEIHNNPTSSISINGLIEHIHRMGFSDFEDFPGCNQGVYLFRNIELLQS